MSQDISVDEENSQDGSDEETKIVERVSYIPARIRNPPRVKMTYIPLEPPSSPPSEVTPYLSLSNSPLKDTKESGIVFRV